jgi:hypothetical protein
VYDGELQVLTIHLDRSTISYRAFNDWRGFTIQLLTKLDGPLGPLTRHPQANSAIDSAVDSVFSIVEPWCNTQDPQIINEYRERLCGIFAEAVRFAQFLRRQRALWSVKFLTRKNLPNGSEMAPLTFYRSYMRDKLGEEDEIQLSQQANLYVELVLSPTLWKGGTMDGERFNSEEAAVPAKVVLAKYAQ